MQEMERNRKHKDPDIFKYQNVFMPELYFRDRLRLVLTLSKLPLV